MRKNSQPNREESGEVPDAVPLVRNPFHVPRKAISPATDIAIRRRRRAQALRRLQRVVVPRPRRSTVMRAVVQVDVLIVVARRAASSPRRRRRRRSRVRRFRRRARPADVTTPCPSPPRRRGTWDSPLRSVPQDLAEHEHEERAEQDGDSPRLVPDLEADLPQPVARACGRSSAPRTRRCRRHRATGRRAILGVIRHRRARRSRCSQRPRRERARLVVTGSTAPRRAAAPPASRCGRGTPPIDAHASRSRPEQRRDPGATGDRAAAPCAAGRRGRSGGRSTRPPGGSAGRARAPRPQPHRRCPEARRRASGARPRRRQTWCAAGSPVRGARHRVRHRGRYGVPAAHGRAAATTHRREQQRRCETHARQAPECARRARGSRHTAISPTNFAVL